MSMQTIPLDTSPNQAFQCTLNVDGANVTLYFNIRYNETAKYWQMTISDPVTKEIYLDSVPLLPGNFPSGNLLEQHAHLGIGSAFMLNVTNVAMDHPDDTNLGTDFILVWSDTI
jgi:hypothetical protein